MPWRIDYMCDNNNDDDNNNNNNNNFYLVSESTKIQYK